MQKRARVAVKGRVQGVGFRPTVYRYATELGLSGFVQNTPTGILAEIQGEAPSVSAFLDRLHANPPKQARIDQLRVEDIPLGPNGGFSIRPSGRSGDLDVGFPPDLAACEDCVRDLHDPQDRRFRYPFTNCTNCGPRFTIVRDLPYDREKTSMASFDLCPACRAEFEDPADRRFDAQPNACPVCGPSLALRSADGADVRTDDPLRETARLLREGQIVALKSLGGYHLACDAKNEDAVRALRERKGRPDKPFAVMFQSLEEIRRYAEVGEAEARELESPAAPVVILKRKDNEGLSTLISPDTADVGAFLPYTPLHHLLLSAVHPLVMTSGNLSEEPIAKDEEELKRILGRVADHALIHDRPIVRRCDDSVLKVVAGERLFYRRSRGFVPGHIALPLDGPPVLACGAELKNAFCVTRGREAFVSQHVGDLVEYPAYRFYGESVDDLLKLLQVKPGVVAHDMHPDYESTRFAGAYPAATKVAVQHHHAHIASCMAEHGLAEPVIGVALDGTGYGPDGTVWGGEFLVGDLRDFRRAGRLKQYRMPGGEEAIRHPVRMAFSVLVAECGDEAEKIASRLLAIPVAERAVLRQLIQGGVHAPLTSSAGRLFDAVSALLGLCDTISYEGQAAIRLQTAAQAASNDAYPFDIQRDTGILILSFAPMVRCVVDDIAGGVEKGAIAAKFHRTVAKGVADMCAALSERESVRKVALSGGVFQNDILLGLVTDELSARGFEVYSHRQVPPNDGGISLGQAAVALARQRS